MIKNFRCLETQTLYEGCRSARFENIKTVAERKLQMLDSANTLDFLRSPPGNRLEALKRNRIGQHSIRINDQWRICFRWREGDAFEVEIADYH